MLSFHLSHIQNHSVLLPRLIVSTEWSVANLNWRLATKYVLARFGVYSISVNHKNSLTEYKSRKDNSRKCDCNKLVQRHIRRSILIRNLKLGMDVFISFYFYFHSIIHVRLFFSELYNDNIGVSIEKFHVKKCLIIIWYDKAFDEHPRITYSFTNRRLCNWVLLWAGLISLSNENNYFQTFTKLKKSTFSSNHLDLDERQYSRKMQNFKLPTKFQKKKFQNLS